MKLDDVIQQPGQMERIQQESVLGRMNVAKVGTVVRYNESTKCVDVQPAVRELHSSKVPPLLTGVPVVFIGGFTYDITVGDECIVICADSSIDGWWQSGKVSSPVTARKHDLSDGFALVGVHSLPNKDKGENLNDILDEHEGSMHRIEEALAKVSVGNTHSAITIGEYVYVRDHATLSEGLYKAITNISANEALTRNNLTGIVDVLSSIEKKKADRTEVALKADKSSIAIIVEWSTASEDVHSGQYVIVMNSTISGVTNGLYVAKNNVTAGTAFTSSDLEAVTTAGFNHLREHIPFVENAVKGNKLYVIQHDDDDSVNVIIDVLKNDGDCAVVRGTTTLASWAGLTSGAVVGIFTRVGDQDNESSRLDYFITKQNGTMAIGRLNNINNASPLEWVYHVTPADADSLFKTITFSVDYKNKTSGSTEGYTVSDLTPSEAIPSGYTPLAIRTFSSGNNNVVAYFISAARFVAGNTNNCLGLKFNAAIGSTASTASVQVVYARSGFFA